MDVAATAVEVGETSNLVVVDQMATKEEEVGALISTIHQQYQTESNRCMVSAFITQEMGSAVLVILAGCRYHNLLAC